MCNCNSGNTYNISMGCCVPVVANADHYYTKVEVDEKIDEIVISGGGITSGEVQTMIDNSIAEIDIPTVPTKVSAFENDVPYLTEHQDLSKYALKTDIPDISGKADKSEIPSLDGYATEQWVEDQGYLKSHQSLEGYVTENDLTAYTYDKDTIDEKIAGGGHFDPTQYYTTANTYNKTEIDNLIPIIPTSNTAFTNDAGYLTEHQPIKTINGNVLVGNGNVQLDIPKIWHGTKAEYNYIEHKDADTIYLIYEN